MFASPRVSVPLLDATGALQCGVGPSLPQSYLEAVNGVKIGPKRARVEQPHTVSNRRGDRHRERPTLV